MTKYQDLARALLDERYGALKLSVHRTLDRSDDARVIYDTAIDLIADTIEAADSAIPVGSPLVDLVLDRLTGSHDERGEATRRTFAPSDVRDRVTNASRLLVLAAGGEIVVPFHLVDELKDIELDQIDEPLRSRCVYRTKRRGGAAGAVVDNYAVEVGGRRVGKTHRLAQMTAAELKAGNRVIDGTSGDEIVGVPGYDDGRQIDG